MKTSIQSFVLLVCMCLSSSCTDEMLTSNSGLQKKNQNTPIAAAKPGGGGTTLPTIYTTGDAADVIRSTSFGIALIGGADSDTPAETAAFQFMVSKSGGGDFVVLRSSGADGYNNYVYSTIGGVNSVETLVITSRAQADDATTETIVRNAEAIFIAGGDQANYVNYWKDTKLEAAINYAVNTRNVPIGGTSAGLAILGQYYYGATSGGSVTSAQALSNPYHRDMAGIDGGSFLAVNYMANIITDSHYGQRDRQGRHFAFMARLVKDFAVAYTSVKGIGVDEATSVLVESNGTSKIYGSGNAYFLRGNGGTPETCVSRTALTWNRAGQAVAAYVVPGTVGGTNTFNLSTWSGIDGTSQWWYANNGTFTRN